MGPRSTTMLAFCPNPPPSPSSCCRTPWGAAIGAFISLHPRASSSSHLTPAEPPHLCEPPGHHLPPSLLRELPRHGRHCRRTSGVSVLPLEPPSSLSSLSLHLVSCLIARRQQKPPPFWSCSPDSSMAPPRTSFPSSHRCATSRHLSFLSSTLP